MRRQLLRGAFTLLGLVIATIVTSHPASAYTNSRLMDDAVFDNVNSMTEQQIRDFILARPNTCLGKTAAGYGGGAIYPEPITYWQYGSNVDAARVIYNAARYNDINPQVIIATLQKEQSLFTDTDCLDQNGVARLPKAMGQGCPDNGACPAPAYAGFHQQVMKGAWQLKFNKERANGNVGWGDNGSISYGGPWTEGNRAACATCTSVYRDGFWSIDGQNVKMETGATAAFYRYTPHLGQALPGIFEGWFGPTLVPTYASGYVDQSPYPTIVGGNTATVWFRYKNMGNQAWYDDTSAAGAGKHPIHLATSHAMNRASDFGTPWGGDRNRSTGTFAAVYEADGTTLATNQHVAQAGQIVKFSFPMNAPLLMKAGTYREFFQPIVEGQTAMNDPWTFLDVNVQAATFTNQYIDQSPYPTLFPGQQTTAWFMYKNTGNQPWYDDSGATSANKNPLHLATSHNMNRSSTFGSTWGGDRNRSTGLFTAVYESNGTSLATDQHVAQPGQIVKMSFVMSVPANMAPGTYREFFQPIVEGVTVMNDPWTFLDVKVQAVSNLSQYAGQSVYPSLMPGQQTTAWFMYKNVGNQAWYDDNSAAGAGKAPIHLATSHNVNRPSAFGTLWGGDRNRGSGVFSAVYEADGTTPAGNQHVAQPGQIAKISVVLSAPANMAPGTYREFFQPIVEGVTVMNDPWTFLDIKVNVASYSSEYVGQSPYPTIARGQQATAWFMYKNTGNQPWYDNTGAAAGVGRYPLHLATTHGMNRASLFGTTWGGDRNRSSGLFTTVYESDGVTLAGDQHVTQPGQIAKISFIMSAPANATPGVYREFFQPIIEGLTVMNDPWTFLDVTIQ